MMSKIMLSGLVLACVLLNGNYADTDNRIEPPPINGEDRCPVKELKGERGDTGSIGPPGKNGSQGKQGVKGDPGEQGIKGEMGVKGSKGKKGAKGILGIDGQPGRPGPKGEKGDEGNCSAQCGDVRELEEKLKLLESNYTEELAGIKQKLSYLMSWVHPLGSKDNPAVSCKDILKRDRGAPSGPYYIKVKDTNLPGNMQEVYCIMRRSGYCPAGITQILKIDGRQSTFQYSSALWTNKEMFQPENGKRGCDYSQTKLATYWSVPFESICVRMRVPNRWYIASRQINIKADSLYDLIKPGKYKNTTLSVKNDWKKLLHYPSPASLQTGCTKQGINVYTKYSAARIGVLGDENAGCPSPDSYIGFGTEGNTCGRNSEISCGNTAGCGSDAGDKNTPAFGYIYVY